MALFDSCFVFKKGGYYFVERGGSGVPIDRGEKQAFVRRFTLLFLLVAVLTLASAGYGFYALSRDAAPELTREIAWLENRDLAIYVIAGPWISLLGASLALWAYVRLALAGRESENLAWPVKNIFLPCIKPTQLLLFGFLMVAFASNGFGTGCFQIAGVGHCDYVKFEIADQPA